MHVRTRAYLPHALNRDAAAEWEEDLFSVFSGGIEMARVGRLPRHLAKAIGATTTIVNLHVNVAKKIRGKHRDIDFLELRELATAFHLDKVARDSRTSLVFWYESPQSPGRFINAVINASNHGTELWLKSIYPIAKGRVRRLANKAMMLRDETKREGSAR